MFQQMLHICKLRLHRTRDYVYIPAHGMLCHTWVRKVHLSLFTYEYNQKYMRHFDATNPPDSSGSDRPYYFKWVAANPSFSVFRIPHKCTNCRAEAKRWKTEFHSFIYFRDGDSFAPIAPSRCQFDIIKSSSKVTYFITLGIICERLMFRCSRSVRWNAIFFHKISRSVDALFANCWTKWKIKIDMIGEPYMCVCVCTLNELPKFFIEFTIHFLLIEHNPHMLHSAHQSNKTRHANAIPSISADILRIIKLYLNSIGSHINIRSTTTSYWRRPRHRPPSLPYLGIMRRYWIEYLGRMCQEALRDRECEWASESEIEGEEERFRGRNIEREEDRLR